SLGSNYAHLKGIVIRYAGDNGLYVSGSNNIIERCEFYGNCDTGCQLKNGSGNLILNCDSHHNFDYQTGGTSSPDWGGNADGFADKQYTNTGEPNVFDGCRAWCNSDDGWDFYQKIGNSIIRNSICYQNGQRTYDMTNFARYNTDQTWFDGFPRTIRNITSTLDSIHNYGNGNGFKLGGDKTAHQVTVTNCLSVANNVKGFDQNNNAGTMTLYNNSAYNNSSDYGFNNNTCGSLIIKNCVSLATRSNNSLNCQTVTNDHNSWNTSGVTCNAADFLSIDTTILLSPRQANGDLPILPFMRLVENSDLIDAGVNVNLPFTGVAPDLGCYEREGDLVYPSFITAPENRTQTVPQETAIANIVFVWGGTATGLSVQNLPSGLQTATDDAAKTLTISGSIAATGIYTYTVSTVGGTGAAVTTTGTITVISSATIVSPSNRIQTVRPETAIANIVFAWGGTATGLSVQNLPDGLQSATDNVAKTLTISGSIASAGTYTYTVSTVGGGAIVTASGTITVTSVVARSIAYVTNITDARTDKFYTALSQNTDFEVTKVDGTQAGIDFSGYDAIVLAEFLGSTVTGVSQVKAQIPNKAILNMKVFSYPKTETWNWGGTASDWAAPADTRAVVVPTEKKTHPIFTDVTFTGDNNDEVELITQNASNGKGINSINTNAWNITQGALNVLGTIKGQTANDISIMEIPVGTVIGGTEIVHTFLQIGISGDGYPFASDNAITIVNNAVKLLLGISTDVVTPKSETRLLVSNFVSNQIELYKPETIAHIDIISLSGMLVFSTNSGQRNIDLTNLQSGVYIVKAQLQSGEVVTEKLLKK
ncbi:MAG: T9SS type A sorting domain-containing protein, partial [Paludibacter sp.]|nr:T9SS type A sorting domain-containing protein [Paludibacter sp.]